MTEQREEASETDVIAWEITQLLHHVEVYLGITKQERLSLHGIQERLPTAWRTLVDSNQYGMISCAARLADPATQGQFTNGSIAWFLTTKDCPAGQSTMRTELCTLLKQIKKDRRVRMLRDKHISHISLEHAKGEADSEPRSLEYHEWEEIARTCKRALARLEPQTSPSIIWEWKVAANGLEESSRDLAKETVHSCQSGRLAWVQPPKDC